MDTIRVFFGMIFIFMIILGGVTFWLINWIDNKRLIYFGRLNINWHLKK